MFGKEKKLKAKVKNQKSYLKYYNSERSKGRVPMSYANWNSGTTRTKGVSNALTKAGLNADEIKKLRGK